jgi:hypothetical protein
MLTLWGVRRAPAPYYPRTLLEVKGKKEKRWKKKKREKGVEMEGGGVSPF